MDFDINLENGTSNMIRGAACLASLSRERTRQSYMRKEDVSPVHSVTIYIHECRTKDKWKDFILKSPAVMPYLLSMQFKDGMYAYEVTANVNPHHLMFILGLIRMPSQLTYSYELWDKLTESGVHPDVALYFATFLYFNPEGGVFSYGDRDEYALSLERFASWQGLKKFVEGIAVNKNIPKYFTARNVMYRTHKSYSRDGDNPVQGWINNYVSTAHHRVAYHREINLGRRTICTHSKLIATLNIVQSELKLRELSRWF